MASNNRGGNRSGKSSNRGRNNNPEGKNQYSNGWIDSARDNPLTTAAAVGGAVAAGVFLWSRRNQITDQIGHLSDQISDWREGASSPDFETDTETGAENFMASSTPSRRGRKSQSDISAEAMTLKETGKATA